MTFVERITVEPVKPCANRGIVRQYAIEAAKWITHPESNTHSDQFYSFELDVEFDRDATFRLHVSADQRFELYCDGDYLGMGPDRSDLRNWSFHTYRVTLPAGRHRFQASVHYIVTHRAHAQVSRAPAFILAAEEAPVDMNTGTAAWTVCKRAGVLCEKPAFSDKWYQVVGPNFTFDAAAFLAPPAAVRPVVVPETNLQGGRVGFIRDGWRLHPSRLPEQMRKPIPGTGRVRMVTTGEIQPMRESSAEESSDWQRLLGEGRPLRLKARTTQTILWDLEDYYCGYFVVRLSGGKNARLNAQWAESCYDDEACRKKSDRNRIDGRYFEGYGDTFVAGGGAEASLASFWWRAGRYLRLVVKVADEDLVIHRIGIEESRLPLQMEGSIATDDAELNAIVPLAVRGIQMCAHETYMDCPYYEQMMYVGDARLQLLTSCVMISEQRLHQRSLELLDWSRHVSNFVLMRHPSDPRQLSTTFSMVWIMMIRDLAYWRRDPGFIRQLLPGMRSQLEEFRALAGEGALLTGLPGWSFVDWVNAEGWDFAYPPEGEFGTSGICNLLFLLALQSATDVEESYGDRHLAASYRDWSTNLAAAIEKTFWSPTQRLFADDPHHRRFSEHAQCLAILSNRFEHAIADACFESLIRRKDLARTTIYFSFYLLDALYQRKRGDLILEKMGFWKDLVRQGLKAPVEQPEPTRSDCHAWGSHPLFHMHASLCGIRPASPGFGSVLIAPQPGPLRFLRSRIPHPDGQIEFSMKSEGERWLLELRLPGSLTGLLNWGGASQPITGSQKLELPRLESPACALSGNAGANRQEVRMSRQDVQD